MPVWMLPYVFYLAALAICGLCYWRGDRPLRLAAIVIVVSWTLSPIIGRRNAHGWDFPMMVLDTNVAIALVWISTRWRRLWCAALAAVSILIVLAPIVAVTHADVSRKAFIGANNVMASCQLLVLLVAAGVTIGARRRADESGLRP